jgi:copper(I)-binding protein
MKSLLLALALGLGIATAAHAADTGITVEKPWARATAPSGTTGAAYLMIVNKGTTDDRLVAASTPVADKAELHSMTMDGTVMKMRPIDAVDVKANAQAELKPGGLHVMLTGLKHQLKEGETFPLHLTFEKAGAVDVTVMVEKIGAKGASDMPGMKM